MKSQLLAQSPLLIYPIVALFLFIAVFLFVTYSAYRKKAAAYDPIARLPLEDDGGEEVRHG